MTDWGLPDWRDASGYPDNLTDREWWWQFTRRREEYRALWLKWSKIGPIDEGRVLTDDPDDLRLKFQMSLLLDPAMAADDWLLMHHHYPPNAAHGLNDHQTLDWLRRSLADPDLGDPEAFFEEAVQRLIKRNVRENDAGRIRYVFDLSQPLKPQFDMARDHLGVIQSELFGKQNTRRPHKANWPIYLRALDADEAGAGPTEMAAAFWPNQQKQRSQAADTLELARSVRDNFPHFV